MKKGLNLSDMIYLVITTLILVFYLTLNPLPLVEDWLHYPIAFIIALLSLIVVHYYRSVHNQ